MMDMWRSGAYSWQYFSSSCQYNCRLIIIIAVVMLRGSSAYYGHEKCLDRPDVDPPRYFYYNSTDLPIVIEMSSRPSHQLVSRLLMILLREVLGYSKVVLRHNSTYNSMNATQILKRISGKRGVPETMVNCEVWIPPGFNMEAHTSRGNVVNAGPLGPLGRFGWFMPTSTVESAWNVSRVAVDHWKAFKLPQVTSLFTLSDQVEQLKSHLILPPVEQQQLSSYCSDRVELCRNGLYYSNRTSWCSRMKDSCAILLSSTPELDGGVLQQQIIDRDLDVSIAYIGSHLETFIRRQESAGRPTLFFNWNPNDLTSGANFTRMMFPTCKMASHDSEGQLQSKDCDFEVNQLMKIVWGVMKTHTPDAYHLITNLELTQEDIDAMLRQYALEQSVRGMSGRAGRAELLDEIACDWLRKNEANWMRWMPENLSSRTPIYLGGLFPLSGPHWRQPAIVPGALMAIEHVNNDPNILRDYDLHLLLQDTQCKVDIAMTQFLQYATNRTFPIAGILGPGCSETAEPIAGVSKHFNTIVISYSAEALQLTDRVQFPLFFRTVPHILQNGEVYIELFKLWGWEQVALLAEEGQNFPEYNAYLKHGFLSRGIQVVYDRNMPRMANMTDAKKYLDELKKKDVKIIILTSFEKSARAVICEAYLRNMIADKGYVWFLPAWFTKEWYLSDKFNKLMTDENISCSSEQMTRAVRGHLLLNTAFLGPLDSVITIGNMTVQEWSENYNLRVKQLKLREMSPYASYAYDAVLVFALALDRLLSNDPTALESLHTERTTQKLMLNINELHFNGASGPVQFDGAERTGIININQHIGDRTHLIGEYLPDRPNISERLVINNSAIEWQTPTRPDDGRPAPKVCNIEGFRVLLGVAECDTAIVVANIIGISIFIIIMLVGLFVVKKRYDAKVKYIQEILGLPRDADFAGLDQWQLPREHVVINRKVGEGAFGTVYGGEALIKNEWVAVAVKALKQNANTETKLDFLGEAEMMKRFDHVNIVKLLGVCTRTDPIYAVMEFMLHGNLKNYLLARRYMVGQSTRESEDVNPQALTRMALDIASGLRYLTENKYLHRDLACRNCLVHADKTVKIADFGLARHIYDSDYYQYNKRGLFPVRWMAPESLTNGRFTAASDVWSYGVVLYEIITFGCLPYPSLTNKAAVDYVKAGNQIILPKMISEELEELITSCWFYDYRQRPNIAEIQQHLQRTPMLIVACLDTPTSAQLVEQTEVLEINLLPQARIRNRSRLASEHALLTQRGISVSSSHEGAAAGACDGCDSPQAANSEQATDPFYFTAGSTPAVDELTRMNESKSRNSISSSSTRRNKGIGRLGLLDTFFRTTGLTRSVSVEERTNMMAKVEPDSRTGALWHAARLPINDASVLDCTKQRFDTMGQTDGCNVDMIDDVVEDSLYATEPRLGKQQQTSLPPSLESRADSDYCSQHSKDFGNHLGSASFV